ncbi:MAG: NUDIX hydrolase [Patescibacteria group bacterium]
MPWKILKSEIVLKNKFFSIKKDKCQKTDNKIVNNYFTVNRPEVAVIAAFTPQKKLIIINQYRHPVKSLDYELPAGYLEPHDTNITQAAQRELLEETGYKAAKLKKIHETYASAGFMNNRVHFFIGFNAKKIQKQQLDESEELTVHLLSFKKALKLLKEEKIKDLGSVAGILLVKEYLTAPPRRGYKTRSFAKRKTPYPTHAKS